MDSLFKHLPFVFCYMDDIIITSHTLEEHHEHLGGRSSPSYRRMAYRSTLRSECLPPPPWSSRDTGWTRTASGRSSGTYRPSVISPPPPQDVKQLQQFLGMVNFYRRFLPGIARTLQPLTDALKGDPKTLEWPPAATATFGAAKAALAAAVPLAHPASNTVLSLATDTFDTQVGGVLQQLNGGRWQPLAFYSKKLSGAGTRYSTFDRELLAAFSADGHFRFSGATISPTHRPQATRHIPVPHHAAVVSPPAATALLHCRIHIGHQTHTRPGKHGGRRLEPPPPSQRHSPALATEDWPEEGLAAPERPTTQAVGDETLLGEVPTGVFCPLVPIQHMEAVFQSLHAMHHPGAGATHRLIAARFCWPQMAKAITQMARACLHCQWGKVHKHVHLQPAEILVPHHRFAHIHVDLVGPLPPSRSHTYLFTIIDRTSTWPEAIPLASITAADCTRALFTGWVSRFGVPATITSDRGAQFTSALWVGLCSLLNIQHSPTTAYHPQ